MIVKIKKLHPDAFIPTQGSACAAGFDLYAKIDGQRIEIPPHETVKIGTGIAVAIPYGHFGAIYARSGLASSQGLRPANCVGVIDPDYRGEIIVAVHNDTSEPQFIYDYERIAQLVLAPFVPISFETTDTLCETYRGASGFGSTGL